MQTAPTTSTDPILETQVFLGRYKVPLLIALAVVIFAGLGYAAVHLYTTHRDTKAAELLAQAKSGPDYQKVIAQYPSSGAAVSASLLMATEQREQQQYVEANVTLEKFIKAHPKHEFVTTAKMAMASNLDALGKGDEAMEMYRQISANYAQSYNAPLALLAQAQMLKAKGKDEEARRICETVMTQYRDSFAAMEATQILSSLKPVVVETPVKVSPAEAAAPSAPPVAQSPSAAAKSPVASVAPTP
ncbi:MAG: tetratricopeptide repeat protein [Chthoniobacterales bacterium]